MAEKPSDKLPEENGSSTHSHIEVGSIEVGGNVDGSVIVGHHNVINVSPEQQVFRSLHQLPQPPADFTGREDLIARLLEDFNSHKGATITGKPIHGLTGMGGIGKTALGLIVAHRIAEEYPDAQIFLDLLGTTNTPLSAMEIMRRVILSFQPGMDLRALDEKGMKDAYFSILENKKALLFLDNARSADQIQPLTPPETCALLITSRWTFPVSGLKNHALDVLEEEEAEKFLLELCPRIGEHASGLANACGCLPLALRIAGSFLQVNRSWPVSDYLKQLNDRKSRLTTLEESYQEAELRAEPNLLAAFEMSYNQLGEQEQKHWRMLGVFPISFDLYTVQAIWRVGVIEARKLLSLFDRYSLIDFDTASSRYSLHDLLADYAFSQMSDDENFDARLQHATHYRDVLITANHLYLDGGENILLGLRLFDLEWENILAGQAWVAASQYDDPSLAKLCMEYTVDGIYVLNLRQHPKEQIQWLEPALSAARETGNRHYEGVVLGSLGAAYSFLGDLRKGIEFIEQELTIGRELGNRHAEATALNNLGNIYADLSNFPKAIEFYEQALLIYREIGDRLGEGQTLGNLGHAYADAGNPHKAIELYEQDLAMSRDTGNLISQARTLSNLGIAYKNLDNPNKAIELYQQALGIAQEVGDRRIEAGALGNLGVAYSRLGDVSKAIELYERQLVIVREISYRRGEGIALANMGEALYVLEEKDRAIDLVKQALEIFEAIESPYAENARNALKEWGELEE